MALIGIQNLTLNFGGPSLLDGVDLHIEEGDRLCLLGRNGTGKTSLLKLMAALIPSDGGQVTWSSGLHTAYLGQEIPENLQGTALEIVQNGDEERRVEAQRFLSVFDIGEDRDISSMSGGEKRRVLLAQVLAAQADVILLDEPTNHLDIDTILLLEDYLLKSGKTILFVTHDRAFAKKLANRIAEIDRGQIYAFRSSYSDFIARREELLEQEAKARALFDKRLSQEEEWLRRGLKARRTRNEGRVRALMEMRDQYRQRRERIGNVSMEIHDGGRTGRMVIEAKNIHFAYADNPIVENFSSSIMRGDKVGIVGPNGSGKTTLIRILLGELEAQQGSVRHGTNLQAVYFDQLRSELDLDKTVAENLGDGFDTILINGRRKHIIAYLQDFLFSPERVKTPVAHLSGGERNRLILAKLFARPSNLLVMDEPTNDLDIETLELLEDLLQQYEGTLLLVSHDRDFIDNTVTDCLVLDGSGRVVEYAGGYSDWIEREKLRHAEESPVKSEKDQKAQGKKEKSKTPRPRKLSFNEKRERIELPEKLEALELEKEEIHKKLSDPEFYRQEGSDTAALTARLDALEAELHSKYERWEFLESLPE